MAFSMAMGLERSNPLHNFKLRLKWGNQRYIGCMKLDDASTATDDSLSSVVFDHHRLLRRRRVLQRRRSPSSKFEGLVVGGMKRQESGSSPSNNKSNDYGREWRLSIPRGQTSEGIEAFREKIMKDLQTAADKIKDALFRGRVSENDVEEEKIKEKDSEESPALEVEARPPWNLRKRPAARKAPIDGGGTNNNHSSPINNDVINSPRVRDRGPSVATAAAATEKKRARPKFSVPLSKKEIEEDFMVMAGHRLRKRPKKRARYVQKELDSLFPGLQLTEVTADSYEVSLFIENDNR